MTHPTAHPPSAAQPQPQAIAEPMLLGAILKEKVWGGQRLTGFGKPVPAGAHIGESWELADLDSTDPGGGGGDAAHSRITSGPLTGKTIRDAMSTLGSALMGSAKPTPAGAFPLLVKFLDAREHLSVQVHPSPAYAAAHRDANLKTECWYILDAEPGSVIYKGVKPGVTRADFERALRQGQGEGVVELLETHEARVGDMHNLPSGTVHALGAGVLVAEVQTPSDTTYRVYDWAAEYGRAGRTLHIDQALECIDFNPAPAATRAQDGTPRTRLVTTEFFTVDLVRLEPHAPAEITRVGAGAPSCVIALDHEAILNATAVTRGQTALIPAARACTARSDAPATLLVASLVV